MDFEVGEYFFHYTTAEAFFENILPKGALRFSRYRDMRDPLENHSWSFRLEPQGGPLRTAEAELFAELIHKRSYLLSLTVDAITGNGRYEPFCRGWARARMWEQYSANHTGVCLVFKREELTQRIKDCLLGEPGFDAPYHMQVIYGDSEEQRPPLDLSKFPEGINPEVVISYVEENIDGLYFRKTLDWESEHEYRFVTTSTDDADLFVGFEESLEAIIVGEKFPDWQRPSAIDACRPRGVKVLRLHWGTGRPKLAKLTPINGRRDVIREALEDMKAGPPAAPPPCKG